MLTQERQRLILKLVEEQKSVTVAELTRALSASEATIRRDLNALDSAGKLVKVHGGATVSGGAFSAFEEDVPTKSTRNVVEKERIGKYAASLVGDDDFVFLDSGTTTDKLIDYLDGSRATFVTNGIAHIRKLTAKGLKAYLIGGQFKPVTEAMVGAMAAEAMGRYHFTKSFLGANGISEQGLTTPDAEEAMIKAAAVNASFAAFVLADGSKFGKTSAVTFARTDQVCVITDRLEDETLRESLLLKEVFV